MGKKHASQYANFGSLRRVFYFLVVYWDLVMILNTFPEFNARNFNFCIMYYPNLDTLFETISVFPANHTLATIRILILLSNFLS